MNSDTKKEIIYLPYEGAVKTIAERLDDIGIDLFKASTILALLYDMDKETTMDDLIPIRQKVLGVKTVEVKR